jgi:hypothetical protein
LAGFVRSLRATWRPVLLRFALAFALLALLWLAVAPAYAFLLATLGKPLIPLLEATSGTRYLVEGSTIVAARRIPLPEKQEVMTIQRKLWDGAADYNVALLVALLLATPGWSWRQRGRALAWGIGLLALTQLAFFLVNVTYTQLWPITTKYGPLRPPGFSRAKLVLFDWLYAFFEFMGRGFFALLLYFGLLALTWGRPDAITPAHPVGRNAPCPCGSGRKAKRCCAP